MFLKHLIVFAVALALHPSVTAAPIRTATFNIRYDNIWDGAHSWKYRKAQVASLLTTLDADVVALQEVLPHQRDDLAKQLIDHAFIFAGREGAETGEGVAIAFRRDRFEEIERGRIWLNQNPDLPGAGWDAKAPRLALWVRLREQSTSEDFVIVSTHLDHWGRESRARSADLLVERFGGHARVLLLGDFNALPLSEPHRILTEHFVDAAGQEDGATFTGWDGVPNGAMRIDWILTRGFDARRYQVPHWEDRGQPASDHFPVVAELTLK